MKSKLKIILFLIISTHFFHLGCQSNPFNIIDENVKTIVIKEIEHPLLGDVTKADTLNTEQKKKLLQLFRNLKKKDILKLKTNYIIVIKNNDNSEVILKTNGSFVSLSNNDYYYKFSENMIDKINIK